MQNVKKSKSLSVFSKKTTADIFESIIGAIYLDGGLSEAKKLIDKHIIVSDEHIAEVIADCVDYKTKLQEDMQGQGKSFEYKILSSFGQDHDKTFECGLFIDGELVTKSHGKSIQLAEEQCARNYYDKN